MIAESAVRLQELATEATEDEEKRWVARAQAGDEAAYGWLLERYRARAVRLAAHVLRDSGDAEDAAQEAFIRAFRAMRSFRSEGRFYTWLYHIVVRVCLDYRKRPGWQTEVIEAEGPPPAADAHGPGTDAVEARIVVESLLDQLTPPIRAALVLRELEGLSYEEIAGVLGIRVGTVRSRLSSARAEFRELYMQGLKEAENV